MCFSVSLQHEQIDAYVEDNCVSMDDGVSYCNLCQFSSSHKLKSIQRLSVKRHIESMHIQTDPFNCHQCGKALKTRRSLTDHITRHHKH